MESGLSYREAFDMPIDELELYVYLCASRSYRIEDAIKPNP